MKNVEKNHNAKPFVKWAGGKSQILSEIRRRYPLELGKNISKYAEPFVGGGAVLFDILNNYSMEEVYIGDINKELIYTYTSIRDRCTCLIEILRELEKGYLLGSEEERKQIYYENRDRFNTLKDKKDNSIELASLFIFLNRTCFNGLYRVNAKGEYNVPQGNYKNPCICDAENLKNVSDKLQGVDIVCGDYKLSESFIDDKTFVYFDPPYRPLSATSSFTSYAHDKFDDAAQVELARFVDEVSERGAYIAASNSDPKNIDESDEFFDALYAKHKIIRIEAKRAINAKSNGRGKIRELLIANSEGDCMRDFNAWLSNFKSSISTYEYYTDFEKVYQNISKIKVELNILNSLIGSTNIEAEFENIVARYPETLKCIPLLLAVRAKELYAVDDGREFVYSFEQANYSIDQYKEFMRKTGLFNLLSKHIVNNLVDYATGIETGLDSNARKNRGGHLMENLVESYLIRAGFVNDITYFKEMKTGDIERKWAVDLSSLSNSGKTVKKFDFVVKTETNIYAVETNFYAGGGSKLNETARSYKTLAVEANKISGFEFVWITDGKGWKDARNNLEETFDIMKHIYSISDLEDGIMKKVFI